MVMGPTHATSGAVVWLAGGGVVTTVLGYAQQPGELAVYTAVCAGAALLPDLDVSGAVLRRRGGGTAARALGLPSLILAEAVEKLSLGIYKLTRSSADPRRRNGHRTFTHTLAFALLLGGLVSLLVLRFGKPVVLAVLFFTLALAIRGLLAEWVAKHGWLVTTAASAAVTVIAFAGLPAEGYPLLGIAVGVGCLVHMLGDLITHHGCPLLWPIPIAGRTWYNVTLPGDLAVKAGGRFERVVLLPALTFLAFAAAAWQVPVIQEWLLNLTQSFDRAPEAGG